jgi:hypothetical protein
LRNACCFWHVYTSSQMRIQKAGTTYIVVGLFVRDAFLNLLFPALLLPATSVSTLPCKQQGMDSVGEYKGSMPACQYRRSKLLYILCSLASKLLSGASRRARYAKNRCGAPHACEGLSVQFYTQNPRSSQYAMPRPWGCTCFETGRRLRVARTSTLARSP